DVKIALTIVGCPLRTQIETDVTSMVLAVPGVSAVLVETGFMDTQERSALMDRARRRASETAEATEVSERTRILAISSGKGGVGKSSITVNLAVSLAKRGLTVGLLDADIWGFSVPRMLGVSGELRAGEDRKIVPLEKTFGAGKVKVISMGFLAQEDSAIMWRGLMLNKAVEQFLRDVAWGDLDYLLIDMPPGTGDVQMGLARMLPRSEMVIVTTPPLAAQKVASRAASMARKGYLRIAGVIENMSSFTCEHGGSYPLFGSGGGERLAREIGVPLIGSVPIDPSIAAGGDEGQPVSSDSGNPMTIVFEKIADRIIRDIAPVVEMAGCSARMLENVEAALTQASPAGG
ncbi:MAG TPA: Mrp/NBP35 family ATP-binding protein, partial [Acidimicrobiales bacterium]|nr:Mrp/NBP35 family ATP-binding protein [Acidimicrobiales bacterium]